MFYSCMKKRETIFVFKTFPLKTMWWLHTFGNQYSFLNSYGTYVTLNCSVLLIFNPFAIFSGNFGTVFVDQSYWQSSVAAKPKQGVWGFLTGGLVWFAVPFTFASTMGLSYIALSSQAGQNLLSEDDINAGKDFFL